MKVGIYARVSTQEQAQNGHSIDEQIARMTAYCEAMKWTVYNRFIDAGCSGANTDRPELQKLILAAKNRKIDKVLVYKLDRLSRSQKDTLSLIEDSFLAAGVDFVSITENFDTSTPLGRAMVGILAVFAQLEREQIKERMTMGKDARIRQGKWTGGVPPFGYDYKDGNLIVNRTEADQVKELFDLFVSGKPLYRICDSFNEMGLRLRNGEWNLWSAEYIIQNKIYCGYIRHRDGWFKGLHDPIISEELFEKAQTVEQENKKRYHETGTPVGASTISTYFGGLIFCGCCGNKYGKRVSGRKNRYFTYACYSRFKNKRTKNKDLSCRNKIYRVDEFDEIIFNEIRKLSFEPLPEPEDRSEKLHLLQAELSKVESQISRFYDLYGLGRFDLEQLDKKIAPLEAQKALLNGEIEKEQNYKPIDKYAAEAAIKSFDDVLQKGSFQEIRSVIECLIEKIVIDGEDIRIYWRF